MSDQTKIRAAAANGVTKFKGLMEKPWRRDQP